MNRRTMRIAALQTAIGHVFSRPELLDAALRHSSAAYELGLASNERLEFLGDAALSHAVAAMVYERWPDATEGDLTRARAALVRGRTLAPLARTLGLSELLAVAPGVEPSDSVLADGLEALLGALLLDGGWRSLRTAVRRLLAPALEELRPDQLALEEPKSTLQELAQKRGLPLPLYREVEVRGPAHGRVYVFEVEFAGRIVARGEGGSKRAAQQAAARCALEALVPQG
jgi:ribonuclease III